MFENCGVFLLLDDEVQLLGIDYDTQRKINDIFSSGIERLQSKKPIKFDGKYKPDHDELLAIDEFLIEDSIKDAIRNPNGVDTFTYDLDELNEKEIKAIFLGKREEEQGKEVFTICFQKFRKDQYLSRNKLNLFLDSDVYKSEKRPGIGIGYTVDALFHGEMLKFESYYFARQIFNLNSYYRSATDQEVEEFSKLDVLDLSNFEDFANMADTSVRRKIASINDSGVLSDYSPDKIKKLATTVGIEIEIENNKIVFPKDKKEFKNILKFLDEDVFKGVFSDETFVTNSKRTV